MHRDSSSPAASQPYTSADSSAETTDLIDYLLSEALALNASDVILVNGSPPTLRVNGALKSLPGGELSTDDIWNLLTPLMSPTRLEELNHQKCLDFCFERRSAGRFRANVHFQRGTIAASIRILPSQIPTLDSLHLPQSLAALAERRQGLILLTGATGCGKTSTMAALINAIN